MSIKATTTITITTTTTTTTTNTTTTTATAAAVRPDDICRVIIRYNIPFQVHNV